jgi:hypothetical protein
LIISFVGGDILVVGFPDKEKVVDAEIDLDVAVDATEDNSLSGGSAAA